MFFNGLTCFNKKEINIISENSKVNIVKTLMKIHNQIDEDQIDDDKDEFDKKVKKHKKPDVKDFSENDFKKFMEQIFLDINPLDRDVEKPLHMRVLKLIKPVDEHLINVSNFKNYFNKSHFVNHDRRKHRIILEELTNRSKNSNIIKENINCQSRNKDTDHNHQELIKIKEDENGNNITKNKSILHFSKSEIENTKDEINNDDGKNEEYEQKISVKNKNNKVEQDNKDQNKKEIMNQLNEILIVKNNNKVKKKIDKKLDFEFKKQNTNEIKNKIESYYSSSLNQTIKKNIKSNILVKPIDVTIKDKELKKKKDILGRTIIHQDINLNKQKTSNNENLLEDSTYNLSNVMNESLSSLKIRKNGKSKTNFNNIENSTKSFYSRFANNESSNDKAYKKISDIIVKNKFNNDYLSEVKHRDLSVFNRLNRNTTISKLLKYEKNVEYDIKNCTYYDNLFMA